MNPRPDRDVIMAQALFTARGYGGLRLVQASVGLFLWTLSQIIGVHVAQARDRAGMMG